MMLHIFSKNFHHLYSSTSIDTLHILQKRNMTNNKLWLTIPSTGAQVMPEFMPILLLVQGPASGNRSG